MGSFVGSDLQADLLITTGTQWRGRELLRAALAGAEAAGIDARMIQAGPARQDAWLLLYGLGGADRIGFANRRRLLAFDLGYWERKASRRKFRVSIGGLHSPKLIMAGPYPGASRWIASGQAIRLAGNPAGPVLLVGNGPKSNAVGARGWSAAKSRELRELGYRVLYRPKPGKPAEAGVVHDGIAVGEIDDVLQQTSLIVCRHSNVAVDACRMGVPVVCEDGAGAAIYPNTMERRDEQPDARVREEFLHRLAWWQWSSEECRNGGFWNWARGVMNAVH